MRSDPPTNTISRQALRFAGLSGLSFAGYLGLTALLHEALGMSTYLAVPIAMACITLFNFFTLRLFIFQDSATPWLKQLTGFLASIAGFRAAEYLSFILLHGVLTLPYLPAYACILFASAACKFLFLRRVLFAPRIQSTPLAEPNP